MIDLMNNRQYEMYTILVEEGYILDIMVKDGFAKMVKTLPSNEIITVTINRDGSVTYE